MKVHYFLICAIFFSCSFNEDEIKPVESSEVICSPIVQKKSKRIIALKDTLYKELSKSFNYKIVFSGDSFNDVLVATNCKVYVFDKRGGSADSLSIPVYGLFTEFIYFSEARSYITGWNAQNEVADEDFGPLIIADYNFDGMEDFAVKCDPGGTSGPYYSFHIRQDKGGYLADSFLTNGFFPDKIDAQKNEITTIVPCGARCVCKTKCHLSAEREWKRTYFKEFCDDDSIN